MEGKCELAAVKVRLCNGVYLIVIVYKLTPFSASLEEHRVFYGHLSSLLDKVMSVHYGTLVMDDFNVDLSYSGLKVDELMHNMECHGLRKIVWSFTREFKNSRSLIDHLYTDLPKDHVTALADHHAQTTVIKLPSQGDASPKFRSCRLFTDENTLLFKHFLAHEKWDEVYSADSLETKMEKFMSIISFHIDQAFPEKKSCALNSKNAGISSDKCSISESFFLEPGKLNRSH
ncbi:hypothetical protein J6590_099777 [Homalodisca vitripennis]|nr:hypothetical protein J6590_099777 [Homalodisca vitripennis]